MVSSSGGGDPGGPPHEPVRDPHAPVTPVPGTPSNGGSVLLQTIESDLKAGVSWLEGEFEETGLLLWNALKGAFVALEPAAAKLVVDTLTTAVQNAEAGHSVEQIESAALNNASTEAKAALAQAGSGTAQTLIAGLRAQFLPGLGGSTSS